mmetsp:Transcript_5753/g.17138  ORF Transcript_5753/g.17138 Transcript_5753/m.17138 type:complete len:1243 (+) Transcript_5753:257-3985(+)
MLEGLRRDFQSLLSAYNEARSPEEKLARLAELKQLFLQKSTSVPGSLSVLREVYPAILELQRDVTEARLTIPKFVEQACRMNLGAFLPQGLDAFTFMFDNELPVIRHRVAQSSLSLFWLVVQYFTTCKEEERPTWTAWNKLVNKIISSGDTATETLQKVSIKLAETLFLAYSSPGAEFRQQEPFNLLDLADAHPFMNAAQMEETGRNALERLCAYAEKSNLFKSLPPFSALACLDAYGLISRLRPAHMSRMLALLKDVAFQRTHLSPSLSAAQRRSVMLTVRGNLMSLLKLPHGRDESVLDSIVSALHELAGGPAAMFYLQALDRPRRAARNSEAPPASHKRPRPDSEISSEPRFVRSVEEAQRLTQRLQVLGLPQVVQLVMANMENLPPLISAATSTGGASAEPATASRDPRKKARVDPRQRRPSKETVADPRSAHKAHVQQQARPEVTSGDDGARASPGVALGASVQPQQPMQAALPTGGMLGPGGQFSLQAPSDVQVQNGASAEGGKIQQTTEPGPHHAGASALGAATPTGIQPDMFAPTLAQTAELLSRALGGSLGAALPTVARFDFQSAAALGATASAEAQEPPQVAATEVPTAASVRATTGPPPEPLQVEMNGSSLDATKTVVSDTVQSEPVPSSGVHVSESTLKPAGAAVAPAPQALQPPFKAAHLDPVQTCRIRMKVTRRILLQEKAAENSGAVDLRVRLLGKMLASTRGEADAEPRDSETAKSIENEKAALRQSCIDFICEDLSGRLELASQWLYAEAASSLFFEDRSQSKSEGADVAPADEEKNTYDDLLLVFMRHALEKEDEGKEVLSRLLVESPLLSRHIFRELKRLSEDPSSSLVGLGLLSDIVIERTGENRRTALEELLTYATCDDHVLRGPSIRLVTNKLLELKTAEGEIEDFALKRVEESVRETDSMATEEAQPNISHELTQQLQLFLALCVNKPQLITQLAEIFEHAAVKHQDVILDSVEDIAKQIGADSEPLLELVRGDVAPGADRLALKLLKALTADQKPPEALIEAAKSRFLSKKKSRFILPVVKYLDKQAIVQLLPELLKYPADEVFGAVLDQATTTNPPIIQPRELLYDLHTINADGSHVEDAMKQCFERRRIFTQEVLATVLQRMVEMTPLPALFMKSVIETARLHPELQRFISQSILGRLIGREIWTNRTHWGAFIRAFEETMPKSTSMLLRLPPGQLQEALAESKVLRDNVQRYADESKREGRTAVPSWLVSIIAEQ